jgi:uncharacterized ParB-like nuclease family protein
MSAKRKETPGSVTTLALARLRTDGGTQPRTRLDEEVLSEYAAAYRRGERLPPVRAVHDGKHYWLFDGFHRLAAQQRCGARQVEVEVQRGSLTDAIWLAAGANKVHGLRRSNEDKVNAIRMALESALRRSPPPSSRQIAEHVGVSHTAVDNYRNSLTGNGGQSEPRAGADGRVRRLPNRSGAEAEPPSPAAPPSPSTMTPERDAPVIDQVGRPIQDPGIADVFRLLGPQTQGTADGMDAALRSWGTFDRAQVEAHRLRFLHSKPYRELLAKVEEARRLVHDLRNGAPYAECPYCEGDPAPEEIGQRCPPCGGGGWVDRFTYENAPAELKRRGPHRTTGRASRG